MTPKEKAEELYIRFFVHADAIAERENAIECSIICVDEIIEEVRDYCEFNHHSERMLYWGQVKRELEGYEKT